MTGVVKSVGKYALLAGSALALSISAATAASMTDAGLEKRVSDLEREVALLKNRLKTAKSCDCDRMVRSGNSRVKVTLYGQVNRGVRFAFTSSDTQVHNVDNDGSSSRLGFLARGRLSPDLTISARIEVEWQENRRSNVSDTTDGAATGTGAGTNFSRVRARHVDLWLDHKDLGQLWLGHGSVAADAAHLFSISGTSYVFSFGGPGGDDGILAGGPTGSANTIGRHGFFTFFGQRENRIMYVTPNIMGFRIRVSHSEQDAVSVGIRYSGNPFGMKDFRAIMAAGWMNLPGAQSSMPGRGRGNFNAYGVSGGLLHVPTGLNISAAWALRANHNAIRRPNAHMFAFEAGWTGKIWAMGATNISFGYGIWHHQPARGHSYRYHFAVNQNLDQAASDVYLGVSYDDGITNGFARNGVVIVLTGIRIRF